jgi:hypothetical protein
MSKDKTPIEELINAIKLRMDYFDTPQDALAYVIYKAEFRLKDEREAIEEAYIEGKQDWANGTLNNKYKDPKQYYTDKYGK